MATRSSSTSSCFKAIPYLSHGTLTQEQADATARQADDDPYLNDVNVRPGEKLLGGPDGGPVMKKRSALETQGARAKADEQADDEQADDEQTQRGVDLPGLTAGFYVNPESDAKRARKGPLLSWT